MAAGTPKALARPRSSAAVAGTLLLGLLMLLPAGVVRASPISPTGGLTNPGALPGTSHPLASSHPNLLTTRDASPIAIGQPDPTNLSAGTTRWSPAGAPGNAPIGPFVGMAYDPNAHGFVAFGGEPKLSGHPATYSNSTWIYSGGNWSTVCGPTDFGPQCGSTPPARAGAILTWDAADGVMLMTGGRGVTGSIGSGFTDVSWQDLWSFSGGRWTNLSSATTPIGLWDGEMIYDPVDGYVLALTDEGVSWSYLGGNWTDLTLSEGPSARTHAAIFYDPLLRSVILYGGVNSKGRTLNDTWGFSLGSWTKLSGGPTPTQSGKAAGQKVLPIPIAAAYDTNRQMGVVYDPSGEGTNQTWTFSAGLWSNITASAGGKIGSGRGASFAWDSESETGLLLEYPAVGVPGRSFALSDPLRVELGSIRATIDAGQSTGWSPTLSEGMSPYRTTFSTGVPGCSLAGGASVEPTLTCGIGQAGIYRPVIQFEDALGRSLNVTYHLSVNADPQLAVSTIVPNPTTVGVGADFGATATLGTPPFEAFSWSFDDGNATSTGSPSHAFDSVGKHLVTVRTVDAVGFAVLAQAAVEVNPRPLASLATNLSQTDANLPIAFSASLSGGTGKISCAWNFGDHFGSSDCRTSHAYRSLGSYTARFWANDSVGAVAEANATVGIAPPVQASLSSLSAASLVGQPVPFRASGLEGIGPYLVAWAFGDGGVAKGTNVSHSYGLPGTYGATVTVTDSVGGTVTAEETVLVSPAISVPGSGGKTNPIPSPSGQMIVPKLSDRGSSAPSAPWALLELLLALGVALVVLRVDRLRSPRSPPEPSWIRRLLRRGPPPEGRAPDGPPGD